MSQLIVTSRYLKSGNQKNKTKRRNYTKYIATRETVEIRSQKFVDRNANATKNQEQLINDLINDFPESPCFEYMFLSLSTIPTLRSITFSYVVLL